MGFRHFSPVPLPGQLETREKCEQFSFLGDDKVCYTCCRSRFYTLYYFFTQNNDCYKLLCLHGICLSISNETTKGHSFDCIDRNT